MVTKPNPKTVWPSDPPYLQAAFSVLGLSEIEGPKHEKKVLEMYAASGHPEIHDDETPWCAAYMGWSLQHGGQVGTHSLMAISYASYGTALDRHAPIPRAAIAVWKRDGGNHVNFVLADNGDGTVTCLGGNQSNGKGGGVTISRRNKSEAVAFRMPPALVARPAPAVAAPAKPDFELQAVQQKLKALGYSEVGIANGQPGSRTVGALSAFQSHEGLPVTGKYDAATKAQLAIADPRAPSGDRQSATVDDLRAAGSDTVKAADSGSLWAKLLAGLGLGGGAAQMGVVDQAQEAVGRVSMIGQIIAGAKDAVAAIAPYWPLAAIALGVFLIVNYRTIIKRRLADHISGVHAGR